MVKENILLREVTLLSGKEIHFLDEYVLPGTATLNCIPIDIAIKGRSVVLNSVGEFGGDSKSYSRSKNKGSGKFRELVPYIAEVLIRHNLECRLYLTPLSPVWKRYYTLIEVVTPIKGNCWYIDLTGFLTRRSPYI